MAKTKSKPRPTDQEALFLIHMRRERAKGAMSDILHGITLSEIKMPSPGQILDYLSNMILCIEMMLKLLSGDWQTHNVAKMFETVTGRPYPNPALMESLKDAVMNQKYLISPAAGIIDHIPELEQLYDFLYGALKEKHGKFFVRVEESLPDDFGQFLLANVERFYKSESKPVPLGANIDIREKAEEFMASRNSYIDSIKLCLETYLSDGHTFKMNYFAGDVLI
jgi:hypothetical protein